MLFAVVPNPQPDKYDDRKFDCRRYNVCLDKAYKAKWPGFTCHSCEVSDPQSREEFRHDIEAMASLHNAMRRRAPF